MDGSSYCNTYMSYFEKESGGSIQLKKNFMVPFYRWSSTASRLDSL